MRLEDIAELTPTDLTKLIDTIGNTPLEPVHLIIDGKVRTIHLKLEGENPTGSVKDRTGYSLILDLERQRVLNKGSVIVESTSGNVGVTLAFICQARGYKFIAVVDPKTTQENLHKMHMFGAQIDMVTESDENGGYLLSRLQHVKELCQRHKHYHWGNQYGNPANPLIHYKCTGPEIYAQMHGKVDAVFVAVSTGGTLAGIGQYFREVSPRTRIIGVDVYGSVVFGTAPAPRKLTGIGSSRPSSFLTADLYDTALFVGDSEAFMFCRALFTTTGILVGGSSGATLAACARYLHDHPELTDVVCVCADRGENYSSSIFNDAWLQQQGIVLSSDLLGSVQDILPAVSKLY